MASINSACSWAIHHPLGKTHRFKNPISLSSSWYHINPTKSTSLSSSNKLYRMELRAKRRTNLMGKSSIYSLETSLLPQRINAQKDDYPVEDDTSEFEVFSWSSVILPFLFPALGGLLFGYDIGATSGATISLQSAELSGTTWFNLSAIEQGLVVSGSLYGALFGSIGVFPIADFLGRRRELVIAAILYATGGLTTALAPDLNVLLLGRLLYGLGIGWAMNGAPLYIAETCPSQIRGTLISMKELFIVLGILLGYFVGSFEIDVVGGWRYMFGLSVPLATVMGLGMLSLPPSPRWLLLRAVQGEGSFQEYKERAIAALSKLRGRPAGDKVSEQQIEDTLVSIKAAYQDDESDASLLEVFQGPSLKAFMIGGGLVLFQQITGQPSVLYYAGQILQSAGFSQASDATRVSVLIGLFKFLMTGVAVLKVDDLGRKPLLIGGVSGIAVSLFFLSAYYKFLGDLPLVAVAALLVYVGSYQEGIDVFIADRVVNRDDRDEFDSRYFGDIAENSDIVWTYQLANGIRNLPPSHKRTRHQSRCFNKLRFKCSCYLRLFTIKGVPWR